MIEPAATYRDGRSPIYRSEECEVPDFIDRATSYIVLCGYKSRFSSRKSTGSILFTGFDNVIIFGHYANPAASNINVRGNNNMLYLGASSSIVSATVKLEGSILIGDECMPSAHMVLSNSDGHPIYDAVTGERP